MQPGYWRIAGWSIESYQIPLTARWKIYYDWFIVLIVGKNE
jgi:hypothetical protein